VFGGEQKCFTKQVHKGEEDLCGIKFFARPQEVCCRCGGDRPGRQLNDYDFRANREAGPRGRGLEVLWWGGLREYIRNPSRFIASHKQIKETSMAAP